MLLSAEFSFATEAEAKAAIGKPLAGTSLVATRYSRELGHPIAQAPPEPEPGAKKSTPKRRNGHIIPVPVATVPGKDSFRVFFEQPEQPAPAATPAASTPAPAPAAPATKPAPASPPPAPASAPSAPSAPVAAAPAPAPASPANPAK